MATYNPYNDVSEIVKNKNLYNNSRYVAKSGDQNVYSTAAQQFYTNLRNNNQGALADELQGADAATAQKILARYKADSVSNTAGELLGQVDNLTKPVYQDNGANAVKNAGAMSEMLAKYSQPTAAQNASNTQSLANLQALFGLVGQNNTNITARGNDLWGQMTQFGKDQTKRYEGLYDYTKNTDFMSTPAGQAIMAQYNQRGGMAAGDATAQVAGSNGGNIDSYSAANANRQNIAYKNAGTAAVLNDSNARVGNMLATLQSLGVDIGNLQNRQVGMYQGDQNYNLGLMGEYTQGQNNVGNQLQGQQNAQVGLIQGGLNNLLGVNNNDSANYQAGLNTAGNVATGAFNAAVGEQTNKTNLEMTKDTNQTTITSANINATMQKALQEMSGKDAIKQLELAGKNAVQLQNAVNAGTITKAESDKAIAAMAASAGVSEAAVRAEADKYVADVNGKTSVYGFDRQYEGENTPMETASYGDLQDQFEVLITKGLDGRKMSPNAAFSYLKTLYPGSVDMITAMKDDYWKEND